MRRFSVQRFSLRRSSFQRSILLVSLVSVISAGIFTHSILAHAQTAKPKLTLDEFFNSVSFPYVKVSPDGNSVVIETEKADWEQQIFRKELWLYRTAGGSLVQLAQSGHDSSPQWSPDGRWIAFLSERKGADAKDRDAGDDKEKDRDVAQLFLISPSGGEAFAITSGADEVHAFAWSGDSKAIYFATRQPWTKQQNDDHKKEWKDVIRYRGDERGDMIFRILLDEALARHAALGANSLSDAEKDSGATPGGAAIARTPLRVGQISI
jgi:dipeptidyl aminopeptidase/acylaminoacyl peptidase